jgi:hypothetical protein
MDIIEDAVDALPSKPQTPIPSWCRYVAAFRERFLDTAIAKKDDPSGVCWLFLNAKKSPYDGTFLSLRPRPRVLLHESDEPMAPFTGSLDHVEFDFLPPTVLTERQLPFADSDELVIYHCIRMQGNYASASQAAEPLLHFLGTLPPICESARASTKRKRTSSTHAEKVKLLELYPWLSMADLGRAGVRRKKKKLLGASTVGAESSDSEDKPPALDPVTDVVELPAAPIPDVLELAIEPVDDEDHGDDDPDLHALRALWTEENQDEMNFYTRILGGDWLMETRGLAADRIGGYARTEAKPWCALYKWPKEKSAAFARHGMDESKCLIREWCRRSEFFFNLYVEAADTEFEYTAAHCASYPESVDFVEALIEMDLESSSFALGMEIRRLQPRLGPRL